MKNIPSKTHAVLLALVFILGACHPNAEEKKNMVDSIVGSMNESLNRPGEEQQMNTEEYNAIVENNYVSPMAQPLSTFSIDVDKAGYSLMRRFITDGQLPPANSVRIEELINYFDYSYPDPTNGKPFSLTTEISNCPWNKEHQCLLVGMKGKPIEKTELAPGNFVFLIDVSGSMQDANKLPLLQKAFGLFVDELRPADKVSIVVYAGAAGVVIEGAGYKDKEKLKTAIESLTAGGSTAGAAGINKAYELAEKFYDKKANNRVILATDGDFNVGVSSEPELISLVEKKRESGVYLSVLGFGEGNYKDNKMEQLADKGNGNYAYIDNLLEAKKVLVKELGGTMQTVAKDVKLQIEFNPKFVKAYRLIGYENRVMQAQDFNDDKKDAGELGSGHKVTALYEIVPAGSKEKIPSVDSLVFQKQQPTNSSAALANLKLRYKGPAKEDTTSILSTQEVPAGIVAENNLSQNFYLATAVAEFGLLLRNSEYKGDADFDKTIELVKKSGDNDPNGYKSELIYLVGRAKEISSIVSK